MKGVRPMSLLPVLLSLLLAYPAPQALAQSSAPRDATIKVIDSNAPPDPGRQAADAATLAVSYIFICEARQARDGERGGVFDNYLRLDTERLLHPYLSLHAYGRYGEDFSKDLADLNLYYLYLQYRTFQGGTTVRLGRFPLQTHRYLTLDGADLRWRPSAYLSVAAYVGRPTFVEIDPDRYDREFRDTGGILFGGGLTLHGIEHLRAGVHFSREASGDTVYREILGASFTRDFAFHLFDRPVQATADALADYSTSHSRLDRLAARLSLSLPRLLRLDLDGNRWDVAEDYPEGRELIISILANGREDRLSYTVSFNLSPGLELYQGSVFTRLEQAGGQWQHGTILRAGVRGDFSEPRGLAFDASVFRFSSYLARASGMGLAIRWHLLSRWMLDASVEAAFLDTSLREDETATSVRVALQYTPTTSLRTAVFVEQSNNPEFSSDFRAGVRFQYGFSLPLGHDGGS